MTHQREMLLRFRHFFFVTESGCRHFSGSLVELEAELDSRQAREQRRYLSKLSLLEEREVHNARVCRRRRRKKNVGRIRELARLPSRARLNENRGYAQMSQGRAAKLRRARIESVRAWAKAARRALAVELPLDLPMPQLPNTGADARIALERVSLAVAGRTLFADLSLSVGCERIAVTGPSGAGKTTLLQLILRRRPADSGRVRSELAHIGAIAQGAEDWRVDDSLLCLIASSSSAACLEQAAGLLLAHHFPLALAQRPMRSLSPGERFRAALICLVHRRPTVDLLVLDEPTAELDFLGLAALRRALLAWPGGLIVASHDRHFLAEIRADRTLTLGL